MALTVALAGFFFLPASAQAEPSPLLEVRIDAVTPAVIDPGNSDQVVEISGTVRNPTDVGMRYVNVHFWRSDQPLDSVEDLDAAVTAPLNSPLGARLNNPETGNLDLLADNVPFAPGATARFTVRATVGQLSLPAGTEAVYRLGVHVRAVPDGGVNTTAGRARVLVPAVARMPEVSTTVLLSSRPVLLTDGVIADETAADALSEELAGRLETLLASAERPRVVGIIDPGLYDAARALAATPPTGDTAPPDDGIAAEWVARVDALAGEGRLWQLPPGDPDLARADAAGRLDAVGTDAADGPLARLPVAAVLGETGTEDLAGRLTGFTHIVARQARGAAGAILEGRAPAIPEALTRGTTAERHGYLLAAEAVATGPINYLLTDEEQVETEGALERPRPHVAPGSAPAGDLSWLPTQQASPWDGLTAWLDSLDLAWELTGDEATARFEAEAYNRNFATEEEAIAWVASSPIGRFDPGKIVVRSAQQFVMSSPTGTLPVTINNETELPVTTLLRFRSDAPQRINVPDSEPVTLQPGQSHTLSIAPEASANGVTLVHGQLATVSGRGFGPEVTMEISATSFGRVGWIIIVVSGAVVLGGTALRIKTVRAEESHESRQQQ